MTTIYCLFKLGKVNVCHTTHTTGAKVKFPKMEN